MRQRIHKSTCISIIVIYSLALLSACQSEDLQLPNSVMEIEIPSSFPSLAYPEDNVPTQAKIELGRYLFYDQRLSGNQTYSCGTCHQQQYAFTDGLAVAEGSTAEQHVLGSMSLANVGYAATLGWGNPALVSLEAQALIPMFGEDPIELGLSNIDQDELLERFKSDAQYPQMFAAAFPADIDPVSIGNITKALASFERSLISADSPYDRFIAGDIDALTPSAKKGMDLFFSETLECFHCHGGFNFSDSIVSPDFPFNEKPFHNNGMYNLNGEGRYPKHQGTFEHTRELEDLGRFKAPSLRNIAITAPYLHDGSVSSLEELIDLYAQGGRIITEGDAEGDGTIHPNKSAFVAGFSITEDDKIDLINFLKALTDQTFLNEPRYSDPFTD